jgi:dimethylargininase
MLVALTHTVSPNITNGEVTFIDRQVVSYDLALQQHDAYCNALENCGAEVKKLSVNLDSPDSCFIEDTAIVVDEVAIITSMGSSSRQQEPETIALELAQYREIVRVKLPATLEGGDVLQIGRRLYVGVSGRTNIQGFQELAQILKPWGYEVIPVELKNCLHLKTACTAISEEMILLNPQWVASETFADYKVLLVPKEEGWAANTIRVGDRVFLQHGFPQTLELVNKHHNSIEILDISEFRKVEAGLSCLSIILQNPA